MLINLLPISDMNKTTEFKKHNNYMQNMYSVA